MRLHAARPSPVLAPAPVHGLPSQCVPTALVQPQDAPPVCRSAPEQRTCRRRMHHLFGHHEKTEEDKKAALAEFHRRLADAPGDPPALDQLRNSGEVSLSSALVGGYSCVPPHTKHRCSGEATAAKRLPLLLVCAPAACSMQLITMLLRPACEAL